MEGNRRWVYVPGTGVPGGGVNGRVGSNETPGACPSTRYIFSGTATLTAHCGLVMSTLHRPCILLQPFCPLRWPDENAVAGGTGGRKAGDVILRAQRCGLTGRWPTQLVLLLDRRDHICWIQIHIHHRHFGFRLLLWRQGLELVSLFDSRNNIPTADTRVHFTGLAAGRRNSRPSFRH